MYGFTVPKMIAGVSLVSLLAVSYAIFAKDKVDDLGTAGGWESLELIQNWKNGDLAVLIRHEERCDRSSNACLGPADGITSLGSERARRTGDKLKAHLGLENVDLFTSPKVRTVQTAHFMFAQARQLPSRHTICGEDIIQRVAAHKKVDRSLLLVTHSTCINNMIKSAGYRKEGRPGYGSLLFVKFLPDGEVEIIGKINVE